MEQLLHFLYDNLAQELNKVLRGKEKRFNSLNNELDVLQTVLTLSKSQKEMIRLFESSGVDKSILIYQFSKEQLEECVKHNYIIQGSTINDNKYFIGLYGLYYFYSLQEISVSESFQALDEIRFKNEALSLKIQEKIWCIFLILLLLSKSSMLIIDKGNINRKDAEEKKYDAEDSDILLMGLDNATLKNR